MDLVQVLGMNKGEGENSYAKNSTVQSDIISIIKPLTEKAIIDYFTTFDKIKKNDVDKYNSTAITTYGIADLGCSSGPNTWKAVSYIMDAVYAAAGNSMRLPREIVIYLNDLPNNDFNHVFGIIPKSIKKLKDDKDKVIPTYVMGVPGTFHGRLFPSDSLHFVHSSSSLHWLSKVPPSLDMTSMPRLNKSKINVSKSSPDSVLEAYSSQFKEDFTSLLRSRSQEVVPRGRMVFTLMGRRLTDPTIEEDSYLQWDLLAHALMTLVSEDLVEKDRVDSFNVPYYAPSLLEVKQAVENEGSFEIDQLGAFDFRWDGKGGGGDVICRSENDLNHNNARVDKIAKVHRAIVEGIFEHHFGRKIMDELFLRYKKMLKEVFREREPMFTSLTISLVKNMV